MRRECNDCKRLRAVQMSFDCAFAKSEFCATAKSQPCIVESVPHLVSCLMLRVRTTALRSAAAH